MDLKQGGTEAQKGEAGICGSLSSVFFVDSVAVTAPLSRVNSNWCSTQEGTWGRVAKLPAEPSKDCIIVVKMNKEWS